MTSRTLLEIESAETLMERAALLAGDGPVAVACSDLDGFGKLNTELGKAAGDRVLGAFQRTLKGSLPKGAMVGRLGGDEYLAVLPDHSTEAAFIVFQEIREHLAAHPLEGIGQIVSTIGIAARPPHGSTMGELLRNADTAMFRAKREGRDRIAIFHDEKMVLKSSYYPRSMLERLAKLSTATERTDANLLREALQNLLDTNRDRL